MPEILVVPEYRDEFALASYPFADAPPLATALFPIPRGMVADALVRFPGGSRVSLSRVTVAAGVVTLVITATGSDAVVSGGFLAAAPPATVLLGDGLGRPAGVVVLDPAAATVAASWPDGDHPLLPGTGELVAAVVEPVPAAGVEGFLVAGRVVAGDVWLAGDNGIQLSADGPRGIRVDVVGEPLGPRGRCEPAGAAFDPPRFVTSIAGIPPRHGLWRLEVAGVPATTALRIGPRADGIEVTVAGGGS